MPAEATPVRRPLTPAVLREWGLPMQAQSKYDRGQVLVVGGARQTPGAVMLAGESALRSGAGRLTLAVARSAAVGVAVAVPEAGVVGLAETESGSVVGADADALADELETSDVVLLGPGLDDADEAAALLEAALPLLGESTSAILDAFALGVLPRVSDAARSLRGRLVLTPNPAEVARLLDEDLSPDDLSDLDVLGDVLTKVAGRYGAVVSCQGLVASEDEAWEITTGSGGLATSGSGDVLAGAVAGFLARGVSPVRSAAWGTHVHAVAGDRLTAEVGAFGFLARELSTRLPRVIAELLH